MTTLIVEGQCGLVQCSAPVGRHWSAPTTTQQKSIDFDHEIMENEQK
jgi:hypothetical protein